MNLRAALINVALTTIGVVAAFQPASAVTLTATGMLYSNPTQVTIRAETPFKNESTLAGSFEVFDGSTYFEAWCIDIFKQITFTQAADDYSISPVSALGQAKADLLGRLATEALGQVKTGETSGAFQLAAWEIVNEDVGATYGLGSGNFTAQLASDGSIDLANDWLRQLPTANTYSVQILTSPTHQNLIEFKENDESPPTSVPEPAPLALLGVGIASLVMARRKPANK